MKTFTKKTLVVLMEKYIISKIQRNMLLPFVIILLGAACSQCSEDTPPPNIVEPSDPVTVNKTVGIAYTTWHRSRGIGDFSINCPLLAESLGYKTPYYHSDDVEVIRQHGEWLAEAGVDYALIDWSNNIDYIYGVTQNRSDFDMIEKTVPLILDIWATIPNAPKIAILLGSPGDADAFVDGRFQRKVEQVHEQFIANPKYKDQYFNHHGKPLIVAYTGTPSRFRDGVPEDVDDRFTFRYLTGFVTEQANLRDGLISKFGYWSWEDRGAQSYTMVDGKPEFCVVTPASRPQREEGHPNYVPAIGRKGGDTFRAHWQRARDLDVSTVLVVAWNEFSSGESPSLEISKDIEPNKEYGYKYFNVMKDEIANFKGTLEE